MTDLSNSDTKKKVLKNHLISFISQSSPLFFTVVRTIKSSFEVVSEDTVNMAFQIQMCFRFAH